MNAIMKPFSVKPAVFIIPQLDQGLRRKAPVVNGRHTDFPAQKKNGAANSQTDTRRNSTGMTYKKRIARVLITDRLLFRGVRKGCEINFFSLFEDLAEMTRLAPISAMPLTSVEPSPPAGPGYKDVFSTE